MLLKVLKSKLHRIVVTDTKLHYAGSIAVDPDIMEAAGMIPYEEVLIADLTNGNRLSTYIIPAERGSKDVIVLGAAARLVDPKDIVIIFSFAYCTPEEAAELKPKVVAFDEQNNIIDKH
jgi:aspartate 1-decarboxylase